MAHLGSSTKETRDVRIDLNGASSSAKISVQENRRSTGMQTSWIDVLSTVGTVRLTKIRFFAYIGGMDLETELTNLNGLCTKTNHHLQQNWHSSLFPRKGFYLGTLITFSH